MLYRCAVALAVTFGPGVMAAAAVPDGDPETPYPGITYTRWHEPSGPSRIHVVEVDLSSQEVDLLATAPDQRGKTPAAFAVETGAAVVINGDYFAPSGYVPAGLARGATRTWTETRDDERSGLLSFYKSAGGTQVALSIPDEVIDTLEARIAGAVAGRPLLVQDGAAQTRFSCDDAVAMACDVAPRTAAGLSADGRTLWLVVVDGWQLDSLGMTAAQLAGFLATDLGVDRALLLDGGSASAMILDGALVSAPSDGVERPVANHLAVRYGTLPPGTITGVVKERNVETGAPIPGAVVTLDDGRTATYDGDDLWLFEVAPRWVCVTAAADGYRTNSTCRQVESTGTIYASVALFPDSDFPDAGPTDDAAPPPDPTDAAPPPDDDGPDNNGAGGSEDDGASEPTGDATGGCTVQAPGGARTGSAGWPLGALLLAGPTLYRRRPRADRSRSR